MEGEGSIRDAAVASMEEKGGLTQPDVVEKVGGRHGGAAGGSAVLGALVSAAPDDEDMVDAAVGEAEGLDLDLHLGPVQDLVVQPLPVKMEVSFPILSLFCSPFLRVFIGLGPDLPAKPLAQRFCPHRYAY